MDYPIIIPAIKVSQPLGDFFITKLPASVLLDITFSDPLRVRESSADSYSVEGNQREVNIRRLKEIGLYINSVDLAFPNSIILSANYNENGTSVLDDNERWEVITLENGAYEIKIPTDKRLASIIDGQHRVEAFNYAITERKSVELLCAIYFDLPETYQAYIFATINYNQKPVPKGLAYELFGVGSEAENPQAWSPEKTAIVITRKLNSNQGSPFYKHIIIAAQQDDLFEEKVSEWGVSTATVVDGIMKLYSSNPKRDKDKMRVKRVADRNRKDLIDDRTPLRKYFVDCNDQVIYTAVSNFFTAAVNSLFTDSNKYIKKTVGIQALFGVLYELLKARLNIDKNLSIDYFSDFLGECTDIKFDDNFFTASGIGRSRIQNALLLKLKLKEISAIKNDNDVPDYKRLLKLS